MNLFHYTCEHARPGIVSDGVLRPASSLRPDVEVPPVARLIWATDMSRPMAHALGLANLSGLVRCDRTEHRFRVLDPSVFVRWVMLPRSVRVEHGPIQWSVGARPAHWWVTDVAEVPVVYDPVE